MFKVLDHETLEQKLDWNNLIVQLRDWFSEDKVQAPERQVCAIQQPDGAEASLLIMPAWVPGQAVGIKAVTFFPGNAAKGLPTINAGYMYFDGETGQLQTVMDGDTLTARRTAASSALAADFLVRKDAKTHLIVGTGQLAQSVAEAHSTVRPYEKIQIWGRSAEKAKAIAQKLLEIGLPAEPVTDLELACRNADLISTITASTQPLVRGDWIKPGTHLDLIGAFRPDMRETDDTAIQKASLFVDTAEGAFKSGDLAEPLASGAIGLDHIVASLKDMCQGNHPGRETETDITVFKSVGMALEDLAAAHMLKP